mmetsp:Transcript_47676/g.111459  ORF Transcript_47676/g.111459 Transcript_47676/m.111459 type:complete len:200 (-) Transcript_47676:128-727(-)
MGVLIALSDEEGFVQVRVETLVVNADVQVYNLSLLQRAAVWDAMANHLVRRYAKRLRETEVIQRTGIDLSIHAGLEDDAVDLVARDARPHEAGGDVQDLPTELTCRAHGLQLCSFQHWNLFDANALAGACAIRLQRIIGQQNALRHPQLLADKGGSQAARVLVTPELPRRFLQVLRRHLLRLVCRLLENFLTPSIEVLV